MNKEEKVKKLLKAKRGITNCEEICPYYSKKEEKQEYILVKSRCMLFNEEVTLHQPCITFMKY